MSKVNLTKQAIFVLEKRYLKKNEKGEVIETPEEMFERVARTVAEADKIYGKEDIGKTYEEFLNVMEELKFIPNSPTLMNAGRELGQLSACFVLPVGDSLVEIFDAIKHAALIHQSGGGTGFSFSRLRPKGDIVKSTMGVASGPVSFMKIFDVATDTIKQGGVRRGANMGILRVDHPDILEFITVKDEKGVLTNFNISVAITDEFMRKYFEDEEYELINPRDGKVWKKLRAKYVFDLIAEHAWKTGDPGVIFIDTINKYNPIPHVGKIESTNPCVVGDTLVATNEGLVKARELREGMKVWSGNGWNRIIKVINNGIKKVYRITLKSGLEIRVTKEHKFLTEKGWKEVNDIKVGEKIFIPLNYPDSLKEESEKLIKKVENEYDEVVAIEEDGEEEVFDITAPPEYTWITNGILSMDCGEQPLLPYESCNLGSIDVSKFVKDGKIDYESLKKVVRTAVHFLDNVIDVNKFPLPQIEKNTKANRKIGLGIMGFHDLLIKLRIPYNSDDALKLAEEIMSFVSKTAWEKSEELAEERGVFTNWKGSMFEKEGRRVRNATVTTIAPTGSISIIAGCSSGIEPIFALAFKRKVAIGEWNEIHPLFEKELKERGIYSDELMEKVIEEGSIQNIDEIPEDMKKIYVTSHDINWEWHVKMQAAFQKYVDNAVSKTVNLPHDAEIEDIKNIYLMGYKLGLKGITVYRDRSKETQVLITGKEEREEKLKPRPRPKITFGATIKMKTGCGNLYVTINEDENGICEVFSTLGKAGGCAASQTEAISRLISLALRSGIDPGSIIDQLKGIRCPNPIWQDGDKILSCADAIAKAIEKYLSMRKEEKKRIIVEREMEEKPKKEVNIDIPLCPECGTPMISVEGCWTCPKCGYSKCE